VLAAERVNMKQNHLCSLGAASLEKETAWRVDEMIRHGLQNGLTFGVENINGFSLGRDHSYKCNVFLGLLVRVEHYQQL
jgi:hypothetical protein